MTCIVGVDVGRHSALAIYFDSKVRVHKIDMGNPAEALEAITGHLNDFGMDLIREAQVMVEKPFCATQQSKSAIQKLGFTFGLWLGALKSLGCNHLQTITPSVWSSALMLNGLSKTARVRHLLALAKTKGVSIEYSGRKLTHDSADAAGIALCKLYYPSKGKDLKEGWYK